ncbi:DUF1642 domain-containing protein [Lactiplantibacillus plantarum]|uniref:DUF1642 domain-containing protein n=1 Tax=Lactiplantibacillus plantarum TaxID=1590 RepID=UPI003F49A77D
MSNETKRDVFEEFADECAGLNDEIYNQYMQRYDTALPDDLPVIPKEIDEHIRWCKGEGGVGNVSDAMDYAHGDVASWIYDERNSDTFARAWLDGYVVEEEHD